MGSLGQRSSRRSTTSSSTLHPLPIRTSTSRTPEEKGLPRPAYFGFRSLGFGVQGIGFSGYGLGYRVEGAGYRVKGFMVKILLEWRYRAPLKARIQQQ